METKNIKRYFLILTSLCLISAVGTYFLNFRLNEDHLPISVIVNFTVPAFFCVISLLCSSGLKNFRLDAVGIVGSGIIGLAFGLLIFFLYFILGDAFRYPQYNRMYVAIILMICSIITIIPGIALHDTFRKNVQITKEQGQRPGKVWRNMQYATWISAVLLLLLTFIPNYREGYHMMLAEYGQYRLGLVGVQILFLFLSVSFSLIFLLVSWLWNQAKIASVLAVMLLLPPLGIGTVFYLADTFQGFEGSQFNYYVYGWEPDRFQQSSDPEVIYVQEDGEETGTDEEDYYEDYDEDEEGYRPYFIGDGVIGREDSDPDWGDRDSISAAVSYFAKHMSLVGEYIRIPSFFPEGLLPYLERSLESKYIGGYGSQAYDGLIKMLWENRKHMVMENVFEMYSHLVKEAMPYEVYRDNGYATIVWQLVSVYEDLDGKAETFRKIYNLMDKKVYEDTNSYFDAYAEYYKRMEPYISDKVRVMFFPERGEDEDESTYDEKVSDATCRLVWVYSFWGRRQHDGIAETVYEALRKLQSLYGK